MRAKVLILVLLAAIVALPVPASQVLAGASSVSAPASAAAAGSRDLGLLLQDPFLIDALTYAPPARLSDADPHGA